ncbi:MAG: flagellar basal body-associated FliL family protein [Desulfovibrionaceae bacterium]|nr:flagellar basal body-associated FliL family protein [Desulfovibrionaceae bacterium]
MAATEKAEPKRSGKFKIILIIIILLLLLSAGAGSFWWFQLREPGASLMGGSGGASPAPEASQDAAAASAGAAPATDIPRPVVNNVALPTVMVNLADAAGNRYLKVGMEVEVSAADAVRDIQAQSARIRDAIIILLSSKTYAELSSSDGKMQLKNEVASRLNQILGTPRVVRVYFTDFVVQ